MPTEKLKIALIVAITSVVTSLLTALSTIAVAWLTAGQQRVAEEVSSELLRQGVRVNDLASLANDTHKGLISTAANLQQMTLSVDSLKADIEGVKRHLATVPVEGRKPTDSSRTVWKATCPGSTRVVAGYCQIDQGNPPGPYSLQNMGAESPTTWVCVWDKPVQSATVLAHCSGT
jgi:hypothetical protein